MESHNLLPCNNIKLEPASETDCVHSSANEILTQVQVIDKMDSKISESVKIEQPEVYLDHQGSMESHNLLPCNNIKLEPASETDCVHSSANEILTQVQVIDKMDSKISESVKIEQPEVYLDHQGSMESHNLLPCNNIKLDPASETDCVHSSANEILTQVQVIDKMDSKISESVKIEQPEVYLDHQGSMESHNLLPCNNIKLEPASETDCVHSSANEILTQVQVIDKMDSKISESVKIEQPEVYLDHQGSMESHNLLPCNNIKLEPASETDCVHSSANEILTQVQVIDKMDSKISESVKIEQPEVYLDHQGSMESHNLLPCNNIKLEPASETDCVHSSANEILTQVQVIDKMDSKISESVKIEQPEVYLDHQGSMESHNLLPSNNIRLEPASETDCVHSSANEILTQAQVIDKMDSKISASVKIELPEVYLDHQEIHPSSQRYSSISKQEHSQMGMYHTKELVEQELSDGLCEDRSHRFSNMVDTAGAGIIQEMAGHSSTELKIRENGYKTSLNQENCSQMPEKPYKCGASFAEAGILKKHKRTHTGAKPYKCDVCGSSFAREYSLKKHKRTHTGEKPYKCDDCGASFAHADSLKKHKRTHTGEKPYKCDVCGALFAHSGNLNVHKRTHTGEKPYKCDVCGTSFARAGNLNIHERTHTGEKPYKCDVYGASFAHADSLKKHKRTHTGEKPYICDVCGASFADGARLTRHKRTHTGEKPYKCDVCGALFAHSGNLNVHKRTHTGEKPYKCDVCAASFADGSHLNCHKRTHTGEKPYKCDVCGTSFAHASHLNVHKRTHTGEKPYTCDVCGASFADGSRLNCHKRTHTGEKPYKCDVCGTSFARAGRLNIHKRTHTGEKPYKCDICGASFAHACSLKKHKIIHTGEKPYMYDNYYHSGRLPVQ